MKLTVVALFVFGLNLLAVFIVFSSRRDVVKREADPVPQVLSETTIQEKTRLSLPQKLRNSSPRKPNLVKPLKRDNISCCKIASQHKIEELCPVVGKKSKIGNFGNARCSCIQFLKCKLVLVTALSQDHFEESLDLFGSVYAKLPHKRFIVYDLGLTPTQLHAIQSYCNVKEVRKFNFNKYPQHAKNLNIFAWKPLIIKEISKEFELFFYCDSSCRMTDSFVPYLSNVLKFPIISLVRLPKTLSAIRFTHQGTLDYLKVTKPRNELIKAMPRSFQAGVILVWANSLFQTKILKPWVDCAEHVNCIAPEGSTRTGCSSAGKPFSAYIGCHRYDQSALNVILIREFGESLRKIFDTKGGIPWKEVVAVDRRRTRNYDNPRSRQCHIKYSTL